MRIVLLMLSVVVSGLATAQQTPVEVNPIQHIKKLEHEIDFRIAADEAFNALKTAQESYETEKNSQYQRFEQCHQSLCQLDVAEALTDNELSYSDNLKQVAITMQQRVSDKLKMAMSSLQTDFERTQQQVEAKTNQLLSAWDELTRQYTLTGDTANEEVFTAFNQLTPQQQSSLEVLTLELSAQMFEIETLDAQGQLLKADLDDYYHAEKSIDSLSWQLNTKSKQHSTEARKLAARKALVEQQSSSSEHNQQLSTLVDKLTGYASSSGIDDALLGKLGNMLSGQRQTVIAQIPENTPEFNVSLFKKIRLFVDEARDVESKTPVSEKTAFTPPTLVTSATTETEKEN